MLVLEAASLLFTPPCSRGEILLGLGAPFVFAAPSAALLLFAATAVATAVARAWVGNIISVDRLGIGADLLLLLDGNFFGSLLFYGARARECFMILLQFSYLLAAVIFGSRVALAFVVLISCDPFVRGTGRRD